MRRQRWGGWRHRPCDEKCSASGHRQEAKALIDLVKTTDTSSDPANEHNSGKVRLHEMKSMN